MTQKPRKACADPVAITGIGGRYPSSMNPDEFWINLCTSFEMCDQSNYRWPKGFMSLPPRMGKIGGTEKFDADFFGVPERQADEMDPQFRIAHEIVFEAIIDAGLDPVQLQGSRTGMFYGYCFTDTSKAQTEEAALYDTIWQESISEVSKAFKFKGICSSYDSACASSFSAFNEAVKVLETGLLDTAVVVGASYIANPYPSMAFRQLGMTSAEGRSRCLDKNATGYVRSDTIACILLQRKSASKRIYSVVVNTMTNSDGYKKQGITFPDANSLTRIMANTYEEVGLDPKETKYIEAHVTGTQAGDPVECSAIEKVFCPDSRKDPILVGCLKSNMGHAEGGSGVAAITKACLIMQRKIIPPNMFYEVPNPNIPGLKNGKLSPVMKLTPYEGSIISMNSFGFGGTNIHTILDCVDSNQDHNIHSINGINGINRLILYKARTEEGFKILERKLLESPKQITTEYLSLLSNVAHLDSSFDLPFRGYFILDKDKKIIKSSVAKHCGTSNKITHIKLTTDEGEETPLIRSIAELWRKTRLNISVPILDKNLNQLEQFSNGKIKVETVKIKEIELECSKITMDDVLCLIGQFYIEGHDEIRLHQLYPEVKFPVSRTTASLSSLIKWNHETDRRLYLCPEHFNLGKINKRFHLDYAGLFHFLNGHKIDGRLVVPATGYLWAVWQSFILELTGSAVIRNGVIFRNVRLYRATLVERNEEVKIMTSIDPNTGKFEITQNQSLLMTGYARLTSNDEPLPKMEDEKDGSGNDQGYLPENDARIEKIMKWTQISKKDFKEDEMISGKNFYKELRVRGYDYEDDFKGVVACNPNGTGGKVEFKNNWICFGDAVMHLTLLMDPLRQLILPIGFDHFQVSSGVFNDMKKIVEVYKDIISSSEFQDESDVNVDGQAVIGNEQKDANKQDGKKAEGLEDKKQEGEKKEDKKEEEEKEIFDVKVRLDTREIFTKGMYVKGMNGASAPRKPVKATQMSYTFRPFYEVLTDDAENVNSKELYTKECLDVIMKTYEEKVTNINEGDEKVTDEKGGSVDKNDSEKEINDDETKSLRSILSKLKQEKKSIDRETLSEYAPELSQDMLVQLPMNDRPLVNHVDVVGYCYFGSNISITEINLSTKSTIKNTVFSPLSLCCPGSDYTVVTDNEEKKNETEELAADLVPTDKLPGDKRDKLEAAKKEKIDVESFLKQESLGSELVIIQHPSLGFSFLQSPDKNQEDKQRSLKVIASAYQQMKCGSFMIVILRNELMEIETEISKSESAIQCAEKIESRIESAGFTILSVKMVDCYSFILARKMEQKDESRPVIYYIDTLNYDWVDKLRNEIYITEGEGEEKSCKNVNEDPIWLVSKGSDKSGLIGFINCIRHEDKRFRGIQIESEKFDEEEIIKDCLKYDLVLSAFKDGNLGTYGREPFKEKEKPSKKSTTDKIANDKTANGIVENGLQNGHLPQATNQKMKADDKTAVYLDIESKGDLRSLKYYETDLAKHEKGCCEVFYSALNFKDIMVASGRVPLSSYPFKSQLLSTGNLGMEFSGIHTHSARRVMGIVLCNAIGTRVDVGDKYDFLWTVPDNMTLEEAATIPVVYSTAYYSLIMRGKLAQGESVLIHAGSGGVGQASIQVCLSMGCTVYTTVGTEEKREFIKKRFPDLTDAHIFDSRSISYADDVLRATDGRGVDIILNSLSEDKLQAGFQCLAPHGRFLEIGKYDMTINSPIDPAHFTMNQTFHSICLAHFMSKVDSYQGPEEIDPEAQRLRSLLKDGVDKGVVKPLSRHLFDWDQAEEAFRFMANSKHVGKVLIKIRDEDGDFPMVGDRKQVSFDANKSYIVVGGLGGMGLEICFWLVRKGARNLVITSRTGIKGGYHKFCIERLEAFGANAIISTRNVSDLDETRLLVEESEKIAPVGGIFNLGMVLKDALFSDQTKELFEECCSVKVKGTDNLDQVSRMLCRDLDHFICFSSLVSNFGHGGQTNYGLANSFMDAICTKRKRDGLPGLSIQWGAIGDVGHVAENIGNDAIIAFSTPQRINSCFEVLEQNLYSEKPVIGSFLQVQSFDFDLDGDILGTILNVLGIKDPSKVDDNASLAELGLDSLMAVEVKQVLEKKYDKVMTTKEIRELKVKQIKQMSEERKRKGGGKMDFSSILDEVDAIDLSLPANTFIVVEGNIYSSEPIFVIPTGENHFDNMKDMLNHLSKVTQRPIIGIMWTLENDVHDTIEQVAEFYINKLDQNYPELKSIDLIAYSMGSLFAFDMALQCQRSKSNLIRNLVILDFSPSYGRPFMQGTHSKEAGKTWGERTLHQLTKMANDGKLSWDEPITKFPDDPKWTNGMKVIKKKMKDKYTDDDYIKSMDRFRRKYKMIIDYDPSEILNRDVKLIRALSGVQQRARGSLGEDYNLSKHVSGKVELVKFPGDHRSFLMVNSEQIAGEIAKYIF